MDKSSSKPISATYRGHKRQKNDFKVSKLRNFQVTVIFPAKSTFSVSHLVIPVKQKALKLFLHFR